MTINGTNYVGLNQILEFAKSSVTGIKCPYNSSLPPTNLQNMTLLVATPIIAVGTFSISTRIASGIIGLGAKTISEVANLTSRITHFVDEKTNSAGNKLCSYANRSFSTDLKIATVLTASVLGYIGVLALMEQDFISVPSNPFPKPSHTTSFPIPSFPKQTFTNVKSSYTYSSFDYPSFGFQIFEKALNDFIKLFKT